MLFSARLFLKCFAMSLGIVTILYGVEVSRASDEIVDYTCVPANTAQTIDGIQAVRVIIDDHVNQVAHYEIENQAGLKTALEEFEFRSIPYRDMDLGTYPAESSMMDNLRLIAVGEENFLVKYRTSPERGQTIKMESQLFNCHW